MPPIDDASLAAAVRGALNDSQRGRRRPLMLAVVMEDHSLVPVRVAIEDLLPGKATELGRCARDIIETLRDVDHRLTTMRLLEEMARRGLEWSERSVKRYLVDLIETGLVDNSQTDNPPGYGLVPG